MKRCVTTLVIAESYKIWSQHSHARARKSRINLKRFQTVQAILEDPALRRNVECILAILDPVCNSLNVLQSDNSNIAEAYFQFLKLEEVFF